MTTYKITGIEAYDDLSVNLEVSTYHGSKHSETFELKDEDEKFFFLQMIEAVYDHTAGLEKLDGDLVGKYFNAEIDYGNLVDFEKATEEDIQHYEEERQKEINYKLMLHNE